MTTAPIRKCVFPVGGLGTRFLPATKSMPKEMLPVVDTPIIHYAFEEARAAGIEQFIFVTGRNKNAIMNHFDHSYELQSVLSEKNKALELERTKGWLPDAGSIIFTRQQEPMGLGHAVWCARHWVGNEPFAVILADDMVLADTPCLKQMTDAYAGGNMLGVMDVPREQTPSYGIIDIDAAATSNDARMTKAKGLVEKPKPEVAPSTLSVIGRYILQPEIFNVLENTKPSVGGEIQLTDAINTLVKTQDVHGFRFAGKRFDCGVLSGFVEANVAYALARPDVKPQLLPSLRELVK
jgi:UTP--glucose-1-phosphate uridylyltransferase